MDDRTCETCASPFPPNARSDKRYCSERCREQVSSKRCAELGCDRPCRARGLCGSHYMKRYGKRQEPRRYACEVCGAEMTRRSGKQYTKVCHGPCWYFHTYRRWPACDIPSTHPAMCCAIPEDHPAYPHQERGPSCRVFFPDCAVCGKTFATPYTVTTCSPACADIKRAVDRREHKDKRRAIKRDAFVARVTRKRIYERDRWRCQLCGKKVDASKIVPHPFAPTIDHIIPLAKGGTHEPANVHTAHYLCNSRKGARGGGEQLMLIG